MGLFINARVLTIRDKIKRIVRKKILEHPYVICLTNKLHLITQPYLQPLFFGCEGRERKYESSPHPQTLLVKDMRHLGESEKQDVTNQVDGRDKAP